MTNPNKAKIETSKSFAGEVKEYDRERMDRIEPITQKSFAGEVKAGRTP